jgi:oxygen-dependent protoporphyrinogen oxidase
MSKVVIVGGGISGLSLAYRLQQRSPAADITVLERADRLGGTIHTVEEAGFRFEAGPNGFLDTKPNTLALCRDVGLANELVPATEAAAKNRFLFLGDRLRPLPGGLLSFFRSDLLSWRGKLSFLLERWRPKRNSAEDESVMAFARRRAGLEVAEVFADALVTGIHAGDPALLSIRAAFPRLADLEARYGSVMRGLSATARQRRADARARGVAYQRPGKLWSFRTGLGRMIEALAGKLRRPPVLAVSVKRIERNGGSWLVRGEGDESWPADVVVLSCPAHQQASIVADLDQELAEKIGGIAYNRVAVVALGYRKTDIPMNVNGFGFIAPQRLSRDLLGVQWCSSIFPGRAPDGMILMRALCGGWQRPEVVGWDDGHLLTAVRQELHLAMGIQAEPVFHRIVRWDRAIPQYHLGHLERVAAIEERAARYTGLWLGGNAFHGVAINDCTEHAELLSARIASRIGGLSVSPPD